MAPKGAGAAKSEETPQQEAERLTTTRLLETARNAGLLSKTRRMCLKPAEPSKVLLKADGKDITKKSSVRKNRFLLMFSAAIAANAPGKLGTLCHLDTRNPVMYVDFPEGRLKFLGTLVFPTSTKYLMLKLNPKDVLCEDVFENLVVFSEARWIGTKEENPEEHELPMPDSLTERRIHEEVSFEDPMAASATKDGKAPATEEEDEDDNEDDEEEEEKEILPSQASRLQSSRAAAKAAQKVLRADLSDDDNSGASGSSEEEEEEEEEDTIISSNKGSAARATAPSGRSKPPPPSGEKDKAKKKPTTPAPASSKAKATATPATAPRAKGSAGGSSRKRKMEAESDSSGEDPDDVIELDSSQPSASKRPQRRAVVQKKVEYVDISSGDEEEEDDEEESE